MSKNSASGLTRASIVAIIEAEQAKVTGKKKWTEARKEKMIKAAWKKKEVESIKAVIRTMIP
jgi:ribosomal protein L13